MYLHTRLLLGILAVTLFALLVSVLVPLASLRQDVSRETDASMQLTSLLLDIEAGIRNSESEADARAAAAQQVQAAQHLRHVRVTLVDAQGAKDRDHAQRYRARELAGARAVAAGRGARARLPADLPRSAVGGAACELQSALGVRGAGGSSDE